MCENEFVNVYCKNYAIMLCMKKIVSIVLTFTLSICFALFMCGCAENADLVAEETAIPEYATVMQQFDQFRADYTAFRRSNDNETARLIDGYTPDEIPCTVLYVVANNGNFKLATLEASREIDGNELVVTDEYWVLSDTTTFITRSYADAAGMFVSEEYVVVDGILYSVNKDTEELIPETKSDSFDFYLTFDEITSLYGVE